MKNEYKSIMLVFFIFFALFYFGRFLKIEFHEHEDIIYIKYLVEISIKFLQVLVLLKFMDRFKLMIFNGFSNGLRNKRLLIPPLLIICFALLGSQGAFQTISPILIFLFVTDNVFTGLTEELLIRGLVFPFFIRANINKKNTLILSAILSSFLFAVAHFVNLSNPYANFGGVLSQVITAFVIGIYFCGLLLRMNNILVPITLHALFDISFGNDNILRSYPTSLTEVSETSSLSSYIFTTIIFLGVLLSSMYMISKADKKEVIAKLQFSENTN